VVCINERNRTLSKNKKLNITFHNPNNEKDSHLIAEDFISRVAQKVVKNYVLNQTKIIKNEGEIGC